MKNLHQKISTPQALELAWIKLTKSNPDSRGISDETIKKFKDNLDQNIKSLSKLLINNKFKFSPTRAVLVPKKNGYRPLQIPEIRDRVVIKSISLLLDNIFKKKQDECKIVSFAYQKGTGIKEATERIRQLINDGNHFILEVDLIDFFGSINKNLLLEKNILPLLTDDSINDLIRKAINPKIAGVRDTPEEIAIFEKLQKGLPQGNSLSPLLSNLYLHPFDSAMIKKNINLVRYADDFVILAKSKAELLSYFRLCEDILENQLSLKIHKEGEKKWRIINLFNNESFYFLSINHELEKFKPSEENVERLLNKIQDICKKPNSNLRIILHKINVLLEGWASVFYYTDISSHYKKIDFLINKYLFNTLSNFQIKLQRKQLDRLPISHRKDYKNPYCLYNIQRKNLGIPLIKELWSKKNLK